MKLPHLIRGLWQYALIGGILGFGYVLLDEGLLDPMNSYSGLVPVIHELVDAVLPILLGIACGLGIGVLKKLSRLNARLSLKERELEKELHLSSLISQMLHEIQNPIHNISAVFEDDGQGLDEEKTAVIRRNLQRLSDLKKQYGEKDLSLSSLEPDQSVPLKKWLEALVEDKLGVQMNRENIRYHASIPPLRVRIHPFLLEQAILTLFANALEALEKAPADKRELFISAKTVDGPRPIVELSFRNSGSCFPEAVLQAQGRRPVQSRHGFGLGLLLLNRMIEQAGGSLRLENEKGQAKATLLLPGERP